MGTLRSLRNFAAASRAKKLADLRPDRESSWSGLFLLVQLNLEPCIGYPLWYLNLRDTQVTDEGVKNLQEALPNCKIIR